MSYFDTDPFETSATRDPFAVDQVNDPLAQSQQQRQDTTPQVQTTPQSGPQEQGGVTGWGNSYWDQTQQQAQTAQQTAPSPGSTQAPAIDFSSQIQAVQSETDPTKKAVARDKLARDVFSSLQSSGHNVKWSGDQLIVDGRPYEFAGAQEATPPAGAAPAAATAPTTPNTSGWNTDGYAAPAATAQQAGSVMAGWDGTKWADANHQTPKYAVGRILSQYPATVDGLKQAAAEVARAYPGTTYDGKDKLTIPGVGTIDVLTGATQGGTGWAWQPLDGQGDAAAGAGGLNVNSALSSLLQGQNTPTANATGAYGAQGAAGAAADTAFPGQSLTSPYTPGEVAPTPDLWQLPDGTYSFDSLLKAATPTTGVDAPLESLMNDILANPSSMDDQTVARMKAASKDELTDMAANDQQALQQLGNSYGIDGSNWLGAAAAANRQSRDNALIAKNRDIDITAAQTRNADRQAAATLGANYQAQKAGQQQSAASLATSGSLQAEGLKQSNAVARMDDMTKRLGLEEGLKQASAELGISQAQLASQWAIAKMEDLSKRYGIDVGAAIDRAKLAQNDEQFSKNLAFQVAQLEQDDAQFGANFGLNAAQLQWLIDQYGQDKLEE